MRKLSVSLPEELVSRIDLERGMVPRSTWIARLLVGGEKPPTRVVAPESRAPVVSEASRGSSGASGLPGHAATCTCAGCDLLRKS